MEKLLIISSLWMSLSFYQPTAVAGTASGLLNVSVQVVPTCMISGTEGLHFGAYDPLNSKPTDARGSITVKCTEGVSNVGIDLERDSHMQDTQGQKLQYELYKDESRTARWGKGAERMVLASAPSTEGTVYNIWGRLKAKQQIKEGVYNDTVVAVVNF